MENRYLAEALFDSKKLAARLKKKYSLEPAEVHAATVVYCDSFDWRLYRQGYSLQYSDGNWQLHGEENGHLIAKQQGPAPGKCCFVNIFPLGAVRDIIEPLLDIRSLLPLVTVATEVSPYRVLNRDRKTVAKILFERQQPEGSGQEVRTVQVEGVRGYDKHLAALQQGLSDFGICQKAPPLPGLAEGLRVKGRAPLDYSSKFSLELDPDLTTRRAVVEIYTLLATTMRQNVDGILADLDSEFLHDFRVANRRTRSGLSLIKGVLPEEAVAHFKQEFRFLGAITGPTRDLDVYLLYEEDYKKRIPEALQPGLHAFFKDLAARREQEQRRLARALRAPRFLEILDTWESFLAREDMEPSPRAEIPVIDTARTIIARRYKRVLKDGLAIHENTPDESIHQLRIQGKKLRYAIEFFSSLFPQKEMAVVIKQLKRLQNNLGDFNDLSVQQDMLSDHLAAMRPGSRRKQELAAALGGLMSNLHQEQLAVRDKFASTFARFSTEKNVQLFNRLFR